MSSSFLLYIGLLHVGDTIKEVNGRDMSGNPKELQDLLVRSAVGNGEIRLCLLFVSGKSLCF